MERGNLFNVVFVWLVLQGFIELRTGNAAPITSGRPTKIYVGNAKTRAMWIHTFSTQDPNGDAYSLGKNAAEKGQSAVAGTYVHFKLTINSTIDNQNTITTTPNMIGALDETKVETLAVGTVLFTVTTDNLDSSKTHTYDFDCTPKAAEDMFILDANGNFLVANTMNYEEISFFSCSFYIDDGTTVEGPFIYELTIENDNEALIFSNIRRMKPR